MNEYEKEENTGKVINTGLFGKTCPWCGCGIGEPHGRHYFL